MTRWHNVILLAFVLIILGIFTAQVQATGFEWVVQAGGSGDDMAWGMAIDSLDNLYITGSYVAPASFGGIVLTGQGGTNNETFLAKYDNDGQLIWAIHPTSLGVNFGISVASDIDDNVIITGGYQGSLSFGGITLPTNSSDTETYLVKFDSDGNPLWAKTSSSDNGSYGHDVITDDFGNIILVGKFAHHNYGGSITLDGVTLPTYGGIDIFIAKYDPEGNLLWLRQAGSPISGQSAHDYGWGIATDIDGNIFITGCFTGNALFGDVTLSTNTTYREMFLAKYDPDGNIIWAERAGGTGRDEGYDVAIDASGNPIVTGLFSGSAEFDNTIITSSGDADIFVAKYDTYGNLIWVTKAGGNATGDYYTDAGQAIAIKGDGNSIITGYFSGDTVFGETFLSSAGGHDIFTAILDDDGNFITAIRAGGTGTGDRPDWGQDVGFDSQGNGYFTGGFTGAADFGTIILNSSGSRDIFLSKIGPTLGDYPIVNAGGPYDSHEYTVIPLDGATASDPNGDPLIFEWTINSSSCVFSDTTVLNPNLTCYEAGNFIATLTVSDGVNEPTSDYAIIRVDKLVVAGGPYLGYEGSVIPLDNASAIDPQGDPLSYEWTVNTTICEFSDPTVQNPTLTCLDNGDYIATLTVYNGVIDPISDDALITITNVKPELEIIIPPDDPIYIDTKINASINFTDPGIIDTHTAVWDWGDGYISAGTVSEDQGFGTAIGTHIYDHVGIYQISVTIMDNDGATTNKNYGSDLVVYNPILTTDFNWELEWAIRAGGLGFDNSLFIKYDGEGYYYVAGYFTDTATFGEDTNQILLTSNGGMDIYIAKYTDNGDLVWAKKAGGSSTDFVNAMAVDSNGNILISGHFYGDTSFGESSEPTHLISTGSADIFIAKYSNNGDLLWVKQAGGPYYDRVEGLDIDGDGNVHVAGGFHDTATFGDEGNKITLNSPSETNIFIAKYTSNGELMWVKKADVVDYFVGPVLSIDSSGSSYMYGVFYGETATFGEGANSIVVNGSTQRNLYIAKYDTSGNFLWATSAIPTTGTGFFNPMYYPRFVDGMFVDDLGNVYVVGEFNGSVSFNGEVVLIGEGEFDGFITKYDSNGNFIWAENLKTTNLVGVEGVSMNNAGDLYVTGGFVESLFCGEGEDETLIYNSGDIDIFLAKFDSVGNCIRAIKTGGYLTDAGAAIILDDEENIIVTGPFSDQVKFGNGLNEKILSSDGETDIFVAKYIEVLLDLDGDGIGDASDNAPDTYNPDQLDIDGDEVADVIDICPYDENNNCNSEGSAALSIGTEGASFTTPDENTTVEVPVGALGTDTSISITDVGSGLVLETDIGEGTAVYGVEVGPPGTNFNNPITIELSWDDIDNNGILDGTTTQELDLFISKDGVAITDYCSIDPGCDPVANTFSVQVESLSHFALMALNFAIDIIDAPLNPQLINSQMNVSASFTDPGGVVQEAVWNWGDGSSPENESIIGNNITGSHIYTSAGVYSVSLIISNGLGGTDFATFQYIVVYDPDGGFVTGGGWYDSPPSAYFPDPTLTGKATFGFVSKYKKGTTIPTGNTEFQFKVADLNFKSTEYQWLVVAGAKAKFKGFGTINGQGNYGFMISAVDENLTPSTDVDLFRIKIWDIDNEDVVIYDNLLGADEDAVPTTELGGGSIVVHKAK